MGFSKEHGGTSICGRDVSRGPLVTGRETVTNLKGYFLKVHLPSYVLVTTKVNVGVVVTDVRSQRSVIGVNQDGQKI